MALLTIKQVADRLAVSQATVYDLCAQRKLTHLRLGTGRGTIRVNEEDLEVFLKEVTVRPDQPTAPQPPVKLKHLKV